MHTMTKLIQEIERKNSRVVVGIDPTEGIMPKEYQKMIESGTSIKSVLCKYCQDIINAIYDIVPAVKPNIAFFERYKAYNLFFEVCRYAQSKGLVVIADAKRADIGSTSSGYSDVFLNDFSNCDFLTVNPYFGEDSLKPFIDACNSMDKGLFVLVKTSNKSSSQIQDLVTQDGKKVYEKVGKMVSDLGEGYSEYGYSSIGAVVGATHPEQAASLRKQMEHTFFLVPGFGAQGATVDDVLVNFDGYGRGAIINASRSILGAFKKEEYKGLDFKQAAKAEAIKMTNLINEGLIKQGKVNYNI